MPLPKVRCVYAILNENNGKMYIGSTKNFRNRIYQHKSKLKNGMHCNIDLQKDFKKRDKIRFVLIENVNNKELLKNKERKYIKKYMQNYNLYNIREEKGAIIIQEDQFSILEQVLTFKEASQKYDVAMSTLRHRQIDGRFPEDSTRKSGGTWLVTYEAMQRLYGDKK